MVEKLIRVYLDNRHEDELFIDTLDRLGVEPFKDKVYGDRLKGKKAA